jgi:hypothetical protein
MVCANWILTVFAVATFIFVVAPGILGSETQWVVAIIAILTVVVTWTMVDCRICKTKPVRKR